MVKLDRIQLGIIAVLVVLLTAISLNPNYLDSWKNKEKVYSLEIIRIEGCSNCASLSAISQALGKTPNFKVKEERILDFQSKEARGLLTKYSINKIPALIILSKDIDKIPLEKSAFRVEEKAAVFGGAVPYLDLASGKIKGEVLVQEIYSSSCTECIDLTFLFGQLEEAGIKIKERKKIISSSPAGTKLIDEYELQTLPAIVFSKDLSEYWWLFPKIKNLLIEKKSGYLFTEPFFPSLEISSGKIKGKVEITYLTASNCADCSNVSELKPMFQNAGFYFAKEKSVNEASDLGKSLIEKYHLSKIPTIIFSPAVMDYGETQKEALKKIGTFETDNSFVLRELDLFQVKYKKLNQK